MSLRMYLKLPQYQRRQQMMCSNPTINQIVTFFASDWATHGESWMTRVLIFKLSLSVINYDC